MGGPRYRVVLNGEEQYSIWPVDDDLPAGWRPEGTTGTRRECLNHIETAWTDMRPLSVRTAMETPGAETPPAGRPPVDTV